MSSSANKKSNLEGIKCDPILEFALMDSIIIPLLHILLSTDNKLCEHFNTHIAKRLEILEQDKIKAINNTILA